MPTLNLWKKMFDKGRYLGRYHSLTEYLEHRYNQISSQ